MTSPLGCLPLCLLLLVTMSARCSSGAGNVTSSKNETKVVPPEEYSVHPAEKKANGNSTDRLELQLITPAKPKTTGTGTWRAIKIWSDESSSASRQISSAQRNELVIGWTLLLPAFTSLISLLTRAYYV